MTAEGTKMPEPDHNKALALAILKTPNVDRFVSIEGEPRTVPMFHLSTLLQYGEQVYQEATRLAMERAAKAVRSRESTMSMFATSRECIAHNDAVNECEDAIRRALSDVDAKEGGK